MYSLFWIPHQVVTFILSHTFLGFLIYAGVFGGKDGGEQGRRER